MIRTVKAARAIAAVALLGAASVHAQSYPSKPMTLVVTFPPGAATTGQLRPNPLDYWWHLRALLTPMKDWVVMGAAAIATRRAAAMNKVIDCLSATCGKDG